jgi:GDP-L-fucose synthase
MTEDMLHSGPPPSSNFSYAYAKRSMGVHIDSANKQFKTKYQYVIPSNLYGEGDKDSEHNSHFLTALMKKIYDANKNNLDTIELFGDGTPLRQFMHVDDLSYVIYQLLDKEIYGNFNVACFENISIKEIANVALSACNSEHLKIKWDLSKPNGQYRKDVSIDKLKLAIPEFNPTPLHDGIKKTYNHYDKISE